VQNILVFRFGNGIFEPIWNRNYVDHVQITVSESLGVGTRGGYYDKSGAIRDMVQNHMMQLVALTAMEPPVTYDAESVRNQKVNVLRSIRPLDPLEVNKWVVRAQYARGWPAARRFPATWRPRASPPTSTTETYVAWKLEIDNWRWNGVPFYIRTGKALPTKVTEVNIMFRRPPLMYFNSREARGPRVHNSLTLRIQPDESIILNFDAKRPGPQLDVEQASMDFVYSRALAIRPSPTPTSGCCSTPCSATARSSSAATRPSWRGIASPMCSKAGRFRRRFCAAAARRCRCRNIPPARGGRSSPMICWRKTATTGVT
jgi:glucose-6-phosphate 1-dehydrogenase